MPLTAPDAEVIVGFVAAAASVLGARTVHTRRNAKKQMAAEVRELVDSLKEQIAFLREELRREQSRRNRRTSNDP